MEKKPITKSLKNKYLELLPDFKEEKTQNFTTLALSLLTLSVFGFFAINPTIVTIANLKKQIADSHFVDVKLEEKIGNLAILQQKYSLLEESLPVVLASLPQKPTVPLLTAQIQGVAINANVTLLRAQIFQVDLAKSTPVAKQGGNQDNTRAFSFTVEAQGTNQDIVEFISSLLNFERVITIETLSIVKESDTSDSVQLSLRGKAYFKD